MFIYNQTDFADTYIYKEGRLRKVYNPKFKKDIMHIIPGEYYVSSEYIINTILGSCISVVLYSEKDRTGGMNHFMLPSTSDPVMAKKKEESGRYGVYAMELLINALMREGIDKSRLVAKVFGGGRVLYNSPDSKDHIGAKNTDFVMNFLKAEKIPVVSKDVGGDYGRKIYFFPWTGKVLVSNIQKSIEIEKEEKVYSEHIRKEKQEKKIFLFDRE